MTHKFAEHLQKEFSDWDVDCEYNRNGPATKKLCVSIGNAPSDDLDARSVYPDIIVHLRGGKCNLLVIEAKKSGNETDFDCQKLCEFIKDQDYAYKFAAILEFVTGNQADINFHEFRASEE